PVGEDKKIYYSSDPDMQSQYIRLLTASGKSVAVLDHLIDTHFISFLEYTLKDYQFQRVDSAVEETENAESEVSAEDIVAAAKPYMDEKLTVKAQALADASTPAVLLLSEQSRRMREMMKLYGMDGANLPADEYTLILNTANNAVKQLPALPEERRELVSRYVCDLASLAHKKLSADEMTAFIQRSAKLLDIIALN
ncbi:MAG: molecular chaperone HtpG, partial [Oscillospiraceae bacterium]|nr:molecular chaperone HtpG [Oscillospiraceae bacterium]